MNIELCNFINLPGVNDARGNLNFLESPRDIPFAINRIYYLYNVTKNSERGAHAHKELQQFIIAVSGSFNLTLDDGKNKKQLTMNSPHQGIYICPMIWRVLSNFSMDAVCLVLASHPYEESDYIRNYSEFIETVRHKQ